MSRVTIVCEALARQAVTRVVEAAGAHGYTLFPVEGRGAGGDRPGDIAEFSNVQIEVILQPEAADRLMERVQRDLMPLYGMIVHASDVRVLRGDKF